MTIWRASSLRVATAVALVGAALVPAANAATPPRNYSGQVAQGGSVTFTASPGRGKVKTIDQIMFGPVRAKCKQGSFNLGVIENGIKVAHGAFHFDRHSGGQHIVITGKFASNYKSATGTLSTTGNVNPATNCMTGTDHWSAKQT